MTSPSPAPPFPATIPCPTCGRSGPIADTAAADLADLLAFEPVPRKTDRADGWNADCQRAFIAALAHTGSKRRAAAAVGKAQYGVDQLLKAKGSEGFAAACEAAMELYKERRFGRLTVGLDAVAYESAAWQAPAAPWSHAASRTHLRRPYPPEPEDPARAEQAALALLTDFFRNYLLKLGQERKARIEGRVVEADFYVRQITWLEVGIDLTSSDGWKMLRDFRHDGHHLIAIAETPMSRLLDDARREHWLAAGDPPRPESPPRDLMEEQDGYTIQPGECTMGGLEISHKEQLAVFDAQHARDAQDQVRWEAEARRDYEARSAASKTDGT